tara:strand:- start:13496 stop:14176 length:681 start_codon:yes stop_codon:yes gene_type:complete
MNNNSKEKQQREELISISKRMNSARINQGTSGNLSVRIEDGMLITPSSLEYEEMSVEDLVSLDLEGKPLSNNQRRPSSEWRIHADIYKERLEIGGIVHCHSIHATAISCHERFIPSFHYMTAVAAGNDIRCATYATFGTKKLSEMALIALEGRLACLLSHHGQIAIGINLKKAFQLAVEVETLAQIYLEACKLGEPSILTSAQMNEVHKKFKSLNYGSENSLKKPF